VLERDEPLHVLLNNAGLAGQRGSTPDGFELAFGTNHLGHFLLTGLLLDRLRASAPARVVTVASHSHYQADGIDFEAVRRPTRSLTGMPEYAVSKLANVLFTQELARRTEGEGITTAAVHPGVIASDIWRRLPWPLRPIALTFMGSPENGARASVHCAADLEPTVRSGLYHDAAGPRPASAAATGELAAALWEHSERWTAPGPDGAEPDP
jgi:NAD(P)-dependent dehydrogenase (short-subunit alcohol dehydrogenase family)